MSRLFLTLLNSSITASWLILAVFIIRLLLKKAPKWMICLLWGVVAVRLIVPFSIESALSLIPSAKTIPMDIEYLATPTVNTGIAPVDQVVNPIIVEQFAPKELSLNADYFMKRMIMCLLVCKVHGLCGMMRKQDIGLCSLMNRQIMLKFYTMHQHPSHMSSYGKKK